MAEMTRKDVQEVIREADRCHIAADLSGTDLRGAACPRRAGTLPTVCPICGGYFDCTDPAN